MPYEIIIGRDSQSAKHWWRRNPRAFSKAIAVNNAFAKSRGDIITVLDADAMLDPRVIEHCASRLRAQRKAGVRQWAIPYRYLLRLTQVATDELLKSNPRHPWQIPNPPPPEDVEGHDGSGWGHIYGAMCQIMPREAFVLVGGFDTRFVNWGGDDLHMVQKLDTLWGCHFKTPNDIVHLWHHKIVVAQGIDKEGKRAEIRAWEGNSNVRNNDWLSYQYNFANGNKDRMRRIMRGEHP